MPIINTENFRQISFFLIICITSETCARRNSAFSGYWPLHQNNPAVAALKSSIIPSPSKYATANFRVLTGVSPGAMDFGKSAISSP